MIRLEAGTGLEDFAGENFNIPRSENPIFENLNRDLSSLERFGILVDNFTSKLGGVPVKQPHIEYVQVGLQLVSYIVIDIPSIETNQETKTNLLEFARESTLSRSLETKEVTSVTRRGFGRRSKKEKHSVISKSGDLYAHPTQVNGFVIKPDQSMEIRYSDFPSEVELAYESVVVSLIVAGQMDLSTPQKRTETQELRREIFMSIYQKLVKDYSPTVKRAEVYGLDSQIAEVKNNLYAPLAKGEGYPMSTVLVGAPGVGKSHVSKLFLGKTDVLTVPLPIDNMDKSHFEEQLWKLNRIKNMLRLPVVVYFDDIEVLLEAGINVGEDGETTQIIDPENRSRMLNLLERMGDTYGIYLMCSLNHPDMEAAFLRRLHPVYFPLPDSDAREYMMRKTIAQDSLSNTDYDTLVKSLVSITNGFSYNSIALILGI